MYRGKYSAVISKKKPIACILIPGAYKKANYPTNHSAVFAPVYQTTDCRQTTV